MRKEKLYVVSERALPEVLLQVVEAKKLLEAKKVTTVGEAAEAVGISRSSFYKYKDEINFFYEDAKGKTISFLLEMETSRYLLYVFSIRWKPSSKGICSGRLEFLFHRITKWPGLKRTTMII